MKNQLKAQKLSEEDEYMKNLIDSFNLEELKNCLENKDKKYDIESANILQYLLDKIDENLEKVVGELQNNSWFDCSKVLKFIEQGMHFNSDFKINFKSYKHLIDIIEYTDDLRIYEYVLQILKQFNFKDRQDLNLRILYFYKILYDHLNSQASKKIDLIDYYHQDAKYKSMTNYPIEKLQYDIEYYLPTNLMKSYEQFSQCCIQTNRLQGEIQIKTIQIIDDNSISALNLSRKLLNMHDQNFSPLIEILKYKILIRRGLLSNSKETTEQTRNIIIKLHLKSFQYLQNFLESNKNFPREFNYEVTDFKFVENFNLFKLETIDALVLKELLLSYSNNINYFYNKKKDEELLALISGVLSMQHIEQNEQILGYPLKYSTQIMNERIARNELISSSIFKFFKTSSFTQFFVKYQFTNEILKILKRSLSIEDNKLMLPPQSLILAISLLSFLSKCSDLQRNYQIFDYLLIRAEYYINQSLSLQKPTEKGYIQITMAEADEIISGVIEAIIQVFDTKFFKSTHNMIEEYEILNNNLNRGSVLATKILSSNLLGIILNSLQQTIQLNKTIEITFKLVSKLLQAAPQLTVKTIETNLPDFLNKIIQKIEMVELTTKKMKNILDFYQMISQQENGFQKFNNDIITFIDNVLLYHFITQELINNEALKDLAKKIKKYVKDSIHKEQTIKLINQKFIKVLQILIEQLSDRQNQLNYSDSQFESQFHKIIKKKEAIEQFIKEITWNNQMLYSEEYFDIFMMLFKIPQFKDFEFFGLDPKKCLIKVLELIKLRECSLDKTQFIVLNKQNFLDKCSPQIYQETSQFSEILHYFREIGETIENQIFKPDLLDKCIFIFEILINSQLRNQESKIAKIKQQDHPDHPCTYLLSLIIQLIFKFQDKKKIVQFVDSFFTKILNYGPEIALQMLSQIIKKISKFGFEIQNMIMNSKLSDNLHNTLENYIIKSVNPNIQLIKNFEDILKLLYDCSRLSNSLSIKIKMIQDIQKYISIIQNSSHQSIKTIQQYLLLQGQLMQRQNFLDPKNNNHSLQSKNKDLDLIKKLEKTGLERQYINLILNQNPDFKTAQDFLNYEAMSRQQFINGQNLQKLNNQQIDETVQNLIYIEIEQETLRNCIQRSFFLLPNSVIDILQDLDIQIDELELYNCLELIVYQLFNIKLNFKGNGQEHQQILSQPIANINSLIVALHLLYKQNNLPKDQDQFIFELLKLLDVLLKKEDQLEQQGFLAINFSLANLYKLNTDDYNILVLVLNRIKKILIDSNVKNHTTSKICIEIFVKVFQKSKKLLNEFVCKENVLETLFKLKGDYKYQFFSLSKLAMSIVYDQTLIRVQLETQIKNILFNQEKNQIQKTNQNLQQQYYYNQNTYPICFQPTYYNVYTKEQLKISKNHTALLDLQKENLYKEDFTYIMIQLFEEQVNDENLILKKGIALNTLNCMSTNGNPILQVNFKPKQETQILIRLLVQQMIESYFQNNQQYQYHWNTIFDVLQLLIQKFPILLPYLLKINCSNFLEKYYRGIDSSKITSKISFLTLITRFINPSNNFIFYICLDNLVLYRKSDNVIVPFAYDIRRLIIRELFVEISKSIKVLDDKVCQFSNILMNLLQIKSVAKICIQNINDPQNSFNFIKTYIEGIKNFDIRQHFIYKNQLFFILNTLNMLYSVAINLLLDKTEPIQVNSFQMSSAKINHQIFSNFMLHFQDRVKQNIVKLLFQKWPLLTIKNGKLFDEAQMEEEQEISCNQQMNIENYENQFEICAEAIEQESINWVDLDENYQVKQNLSSNKNNLEIQKFKNYHMDDKKDEFLCNSGYFNIDFKIQLPQQFQQLLSQFKKLLPGQTELPIWSSTRLWQNEIYLNSKVQILNIDHKDNFQQQIYEQQIQLDDQNWLALYTQIQNKIKSVQNGRKQTLKLLGFVDDQFLQLVTKILQVDDNFDDLINSFLMNLSNSSSIANQIIDYLINKLDIIKKQNVDKDMFIVTRTLIVNDFNYYSKFISPKILQNLLNVEKTSKNNLSSQNFKIMTNLLFWWKQDNNLELLLKVFRNFLKNEQNIEKFNFQRFEPLYTLFKQENNNQRIQQLIKFISIIFKNDDNIVKFQILIKKDLKQVVQNIDKHIKQNDTNDQITVQGDGIKKIFQLIYHLQYNQKNANSNLKKHWLWIQETSEFEQFWKNIEKIISSIQSQQEYNSSLLPYIEIIFILSEIINPTESQSDSFQVLQLSQMQLSSSSQDHNGFDFKKLFKKLGQDGKVYINSIIKEQIEIQKATMSKLEGINCNLRKRSFLEYFFKQHSNIISFEVKKIYFRNNIDQIRLRDELLIQINMDTVFQDSYRFIRNLDSNQLKRDFAINFVGQNAQDLGGPRRHWFKILTQEFVVPQHQLFIHTPNRSFYEINTEFNDDHHLNKFEFIGKIFAKAIMQDCLIYVKYPNYFFKHILGINLFINDFDEDLYKSMKYIKDNNNISKLDCVFTYCTKKGEEKELIPGGKDIQVTDETKKEFIKKYCHQYMAKNIEPQMKAIQKGFYTIIPKNLIAIFDLSQFKKLFCGQEYINVEDLIQNLKYNQADIQLIRWLENILRTFNQDMLARFVNFVTGTNLVPAGGFQDLVRPIEILIRDHITDINCKFPEAYTCFNRLVIPAYDSEEILREKLELALNDENDNFQRG